MEGRPRHPSPLILARGAVQRERTLGTLCLGRDLSISGERVKPPSYAFDIPPRTRALTSVDFPRGMLRDVHRSPTQCLAKKTIWPTW
jgi:hypothetical protein